MGTEDGVSFPQEALLDEKSGKKFFAAQSYCGVAENDGSVVGFYIPIIPGDWVTFPT